MPAELAIRVLCLVVGVSLALACAVAPRRDQASGDALRAVAFAALAANAVAVLALAAAGHVGTSAAVAAWPAIGTAGVALLRLVLGGARIDRVASLRLTTALVGAAAIVLLGSVVAEMGFVEAQLIAIAGLAWVAGPFAPPLAIRRAGDATVAAFAALGGLAGLGLAATGVRWLDLARQARSLALEGVALEAAAGAFADRPTLPIDPVTPWLGAGLLAIAAVVAVQGSRSAGSD